MTLSDITEKKNNVEIKLIVNSKLLRYNSPLLIEHFCPLCRKLLTIAKHLTSPLDLADVFYGYLFRMCGIVGHRFHNPLTSRTNACTGTVTELIALRGNQFE